MRDEGDNDMDDFGFIFAAINICKNHGSLITKIDVSYQLKVFPSSEGCRWQGPRGLENRGKVKAKTTFLLHWLEIGDCQLLDCYLLLFSVPFPIQGDSKLHESHESGHLSCIRSSAYVVGVVFSYHCHLLWRPVHINFNFTHFGFTFKICQVK